MPGCRPRALALGKWGLAASLQRQTPELEVEAQIGPGSGRRKLWAKLQHPMTGSDWRSQGNPIPFLNPKSLEPEPLHPNFLA